MQVPAGATETGRGVTVARRIAGSPVFEARAFVSWTTPAGKPGSFLCTATGKDPHGANVAIAYLLAALERAPIPRAARRTTASRGSSKRQTVSGAR